jgi:type I restriction enzyme S subunit
MSGVLIVVISADGALQIPVSPLGGGGMISLSRVPLGELCEIVSGSTPKTADSTYWGGGIPWITPAELDGSHYVGKTERTLTEQGVQSAHLQMMPSGTVLLSSRAPIGKVAITTCGMACNQGFKNLVCGEKIDAEYLYWFLLSKARFLNSLGRGATFKELSRAIVSEVLIPLPSVAAQEEIASEFAGVEKIINQAREQKALLSGLVQSRFVEMFGEAELDSKLTMRDCCERICGGCTPSMRHPEYYGGDIPFIKSGDVKTDIVREGSLALTKLALENTTAKYVPKDSVLVVTRSALLQRKLCTALAGSDLVINQDIKALVPSSSFRPFFLMWVIRSHERELLERVHSVSTTGLDLKYIEELPVPDIGIEAQDEFSAFVAQVDKSQFMQLSGIESTLQLKYLPDLRDRYSR